MSKDKEYEIIVNGSEHEIPNPLVTFDQVVEIAFPGHPNNPDIVYAVTFEHAEEPKRGPLASGGSVTVKKRNTIFDVTPTNRS
jgi:hypothetical protein